MAPPAIYSTGCDAASSAYLRVRAQRRGGKAAPCAGVRACEGAHMGLCLSSARMALFIVTPHFSSTSSSTTAEMSSSGLPKPMMRRSACDAMTSPILWKPTNPRHDLRLRRRAPTCGAARPAPRGRPRSGNLRLPRKEKRRRRWRGRSAGAGGICTRGRGTWCSRRSTRRRSHLAPSMTPSARLSASTPARVGSSEWRRLGSSAAERCWPQTARARGSEARSGSPGRRHSSSRPPPSPSSCARSRPSTARTRTPRVTSSSPRRRRRR